MWSTAGVTAQPRGPGPEELDLLRREYLRNVSHEFRTPLTVIRGYAEYLLGAEDLDGERLREVAAVLLESTDRVIDLVDTLIDVGRLEQAAARDSLPMESVDLAQLARSAAGAIRVAAEKKQLDLELVLPDRPLWVRGDGSLLLQMLRKLLDNAIKYSGPSSRVTVRGRCGAGWQVLEVEDRGVGISREHLSRIFDKFYMVDGSLARQARGTGVGLYLVREIARMHQGMVDVTSEVGAGSCFTVSLPPGAGLPVEP
jgi:two-component system, OmpR family, phosphate regulon sensor histidine kinase PhoR